MTETKSRTYTVKLTISSDEEPVSLPSAEAIREDLILYLLDRDRTIPQDARIDLVVR